MIQGKLPPSKIAKLMLKNGKIIFKFQDNFLQIELKTSFI